MNNSDPTTGAPLRRRQGFWLTAGEIIGVLALVIAGLNYWEGHQQRAEDVRRARDQSRAAVALVVVGEAQADGRLIALHPLKASQAIQSQRFLFPAELLDRPVDIAASQPRIQTDWIAGGLKRVLDDRHAPPTGEARAPVVVETTYVEDGDTRTDVSLYQIGFAWKRAFLARRQIRLTGIAFLKRMLTGESTATLEQRWTAAKAALAVR